MESINLETLNDDLEKKDYFRNLLIFIRHYISDDEFDDSLRRMKSYLKTLREDGFKDEDLTEAQRFKKNVFRYLRLDALSDLISLVVYVILILMTSWKILWSVLAGLTFLGLLVTVKRAAITNRFINHLQTK